MNKVRKYETYLSSIPLMTTGERRLVSVSLSMFSRTIMWKSVVKHMMAMSECITLQPSSRGIPGPNISNAKLCQIQARPVHYTTWGSGKTRCQVRHTSANHIQCRKIQNKMPNRVTYAAINFTLTSPNYV